VTSPGPPRIGLAVVPEAAAFDRTAELVRLADEGGLDLVGIQDHPYQRRFLDTWSLIATLLARTRRVAIFPDVANLPLRPPAVMAKAAATMDLVSGGRFELGLGAGFFWDAVEAMGGPRRSPRESVDALEEAIAVIRLVWSDERSVAFDGRYYRLAGVHPGPQPAHPIGIWIGAYKPRMQRLIGRAADGWVPSLGYASVDDLRVGNERISASAVEAGRDPGAIRRLLNVSGFIGSASEARDALGARAEEVRAGPPAFWQDTFSSLADAGVDTFVFSPADPSPAQVERLVGEVAPGLG
jgi:alkanesulfonate monooxygenase SsuD/methylene tetrahydromethanopterin reductase-like flavin-dependent oxidoreductase (luciferase family)